jgi:hypothetical protein
MIVMKLIMHKFLILLHFHGLKMTLVDILDILWWRPVQKNPCSSWESFYGTMLTQGHDCIKC